MYNLAVEGVQFRATTLFSLQRRGCSIHNGRGVQHRRRIQLPSHHRQGPNLYRHRQRIQRRSAADRSGKSERKI